MVLDLLLSIAEHTICNEKSRIAVMLTASLPGQSGTT
jgi:uncharacterized membrane protein